MFGKWLSAFAHLRRLDLTRQTQDCPSEESRSFLFAAANKEYADEAASSAVEMAASPEGSKTASLIAGNSVSGFNAHGLNQATRGGPGIAGGAN